MERYGARHRYRHPGLDHKFRVPRGENDEILIATARARLRLTPFRCPRNSSLMKCNDLHRDMNCEHFETQ